MNPLWLLVGPGIAFVAGLLVPTQRRGRVASVGVGGVAISLAVGCVLAAQQPWFSPIETTGWTTAWNILPGATLVDGLSITVVLLVCLVSLLVQLFSFAYMRAEPRYATYTAFISLFTTAMLAVVIAGDLITLVIGWEVMGLCSYVLIGQHWEGSQARYAAVKSFLVTKSADVGFIVGVIIVAFWAGSFRITDITGAAGQGSAPVLTLATVLLLLGVFGKSGQFPFHGWLPDAMTGPSPISALIHAATMVAAGVFVLVRLFPVFSASQTTLAVLTVFASVGMLAAAVAALTQRELKRVLAWSTISQLALMFAAVSVAAPDAATFQLVAHGFFKALLFLAAGVVIQVGGSGDLFSLSGMRRRAPFASVCFGIGLLALAGVPFFAGFFSKESILTAAEQAAVGKSAGQSWAGWVVLVAAVLTAAVTAAYCTRTWLLAFTGDNQVEATIEPRAVSLTVPLSVLAIASTFFGLVGLRPTWFATWSLPSATQPIELADLSPSLLTTTLSMVAIAAGAGAAVVAVRRRRSEQTSSHFDVIRDGYGINAAYRVLTVTPFTWLASQVDSFDRRVVAPTVERSGTTASSLGSRLSQGTSANAQRGLSTMLGFAGAVAICLVVALVVSTT